VTCPHGGDLLVMCNSLGWDKAVPRRDRVLSVASRAGRCPHATDGGARLHLLSAEGQRLAPAGSRIVMNIFECKQEARNPFTQFIGVCSSAKTGEMDENFLSMSDPISRLQERLIHAGACIHPPPLQRRPVSRLPPYAAMERSPTAMPPLSEAIRKYDLAQE
jgi:hypothetical protein